MNFNRATYHGKLNLMVVGSLIFLVICYVLAFGPTFRANKLNNQLKAETKDIANAPIEYETYQSRLNQMNQSLGYVGSNSEKAQDKILAFIGAFSDSTNIFLKKMPETIIQERNGYGLETNILQLEGDFMHLIMLMYELEYKLKVSKISSVNFHLEKDLYTKRTSLLLELHLQNIIL